MEQKDLRTIAAALLLGSLLGCAYTASRATSTNDDPSPPLISPTEPARNIAPLAIPPSENYGAPFVQSRIHPVAVAAAMALVSVFALAAFSASVPAKTPNRTPDR